VGTSAFDTLWGDDPKQKTKAAPPPDALDHLWGTPEQKPQQTPAHAAPTMYDGRPAKAGIMQAALHGIAGGFSEKIAAGTDAAFDAVAEGIHHPSRNLAPTFSKAYDQNLSARRSALHAFGEAHPKTDIASQVVGGALPMLLGNETGAVSELQNVGRMARILRSANTGMKIGALHGAGDADEKGPLKDYANKMGAGAFWGGLTGGVLAPVSEAVGFVGKKARFPEAASYLSERAAKLFPDQSSAQRALQTLARATGTRGAAATQIAQRAEQDAAGGFTPEPMPASVPSMALDQAGPNVVGLAKNVARSPGEGQATVRGALESRSRQMRPGVSSALEQATGVTADAGMQPTVQALAERKAVADKLYKAAEDATRDQVADSPSVRELMQTPAGKAAFAVAKAQRGNMQRPLPKVAESIAVPEGIDPADWANMQRLAAERGMPLPVGETEELPDFPTLHLMKQKLAAMAKLGERDGQQGIAAAQAKGALNIWGQIRAELPDVWKQADDAYAQHSALLDMMDRGRNVLRTPLNPPQPGQRGVTRSLTGLAQKFEAATPEQQQALQTGAGTAAHALWSGTPESVASPGRVFNRSPERMQQLKYAFTSPEKASEFQQTLGGWDRAQALRQSVLGGSDTFANASEGAARGDHAMPGALSELFHGNVGRSLSTLVSGTSKEIDSKSRQALNAEIAKILTSPEAKALVQAGETAKLRQLVAQRIGRGVAMVGAGQASDDQP
jgi:hypothetical protein